MKKLLSYLSKFLLLVGIFGISLTLCIGAFTIHSLFGWLVLSIETVIISCILHGINEFANVNQENKA